MDIGYRDHRRVVELDAPLVTVMIGQIVKGDANADRFVLEMKNGGKSADLSGYSADGLFINRLGMEVPLRATVSGSEIEMVLTGGCYDVGGAAVGHVRLVSSDASQIRTVIRFVADVTRDGSGVAYDPDGVIGDLDALLAKLTAMETATADGIAAAQEARNAGAQAIADANAAGDAAKATAQAAADDATAAAETARATIYTRAMAIPDESALAASHELHAQKDYPLNVTVNGYTYQEGEGDPSPDNVRPIHGLDAARVHAGGKNLLPQMTYYNYPYLGLVSINADGRLSVSGKGVDAILFFDLSYPIKPHDGLKAVIINDSGNKINWGLVINYTNTARIRFDKEVANKATGTVNLGSYDGLIYKLGIYLHPGMDYDGSISVMLRYDDGTNYEPYRANTINPPLLPDGAPLMEGDTVENDVLSGCDKVITFDGSDDEGWARSSQDTCFYRSTDEGIPSNASLVFTNKFPVKLYSGSSFVKDHDIFGLNNQEAISMSMYMNPSGITDIDDFKAYLAANPLTVYYRSTEYTPDKDLRVCRVVRKRKAITLDGSETWTYILYEASVGGLYYFRFDPTGMAISGNYVAADIKCSRLPVTTAAQTATGVQSISGDANGRLRIAIDGITTEDELRSYLAEKNIEVEYPLATPEIYYTDPLPLLPPAALVSETVTVTGSGETEVEYAHDTKHYIDSKISELVTLALANS